VLVTGARGMLGTDVVESLGSRHEVVARDIEDFDITDPVATAAAISEARPDAVVHLAAFADVEACEAKREFALRVNADGTRHVAEGAKAAGARVLYVSTDYVFDGSTREPYLEADPPGPINAYGLSKLLGEQHLAASGARHLIIRTSWLFGPNGRNFIDTVFARARAGGALKVVDDQRGCPTYTGHLARGIGSVLEARLEGIVHITNSGDTTWYELAKYAFALAGLKPDIDPVPAVAYPTKALRPAYSVLGSTVVGRGGVEPLPSWREGVRSHLARKGLVAGRESEAEREAR
jgi:dTDP-4-dehydrorhamnose reductase